MDQAKWKRIKVILEEAVELPVGERSKLLDERCGNDPALRREVEALLGAGNTTAALLEGDASRMVLPDQPESMEGEQIGPYRIAGVLGSGGMGTVYRAVRADGAFDQTVALKLIKRGMDSDAILKRFINERQILASLEHPNIARLIDGGTTDAGLPYFVMEYVEGESIIEYAETTELDLDARLDLFRQVCSAISYAHRNLVIHRDLKPTNILITRDGQAKLLDFGIAKLLGSSGEDKTATRHLAFTPEYASPEQVRGEQLTTATDVYSLGVLLYELVTGFRPYRTDSGNIGEVIRVVCDTEPSAPSRGWRDTLRPASGTGQKAAETNGHVPSRTPYVAASQLRGDIDNIILKALRKEPERRYQSVEQLADDIKRHQDGLPVVAARDSWSYRTSKFVRRNRIAVGAGALLVLVLAAGLGATLYQRNAAQRRFNDVRQLANSFLFEFHDAIENVPGTTPARELVVKRAIEYLDKLSQEASGDEQLLRELATAYEKIGKIQGNSYHSNLGDTDGAVRSYNRSLEIRLDLIKRDPNNRQIQHELANAHEGVGDMHYTVDELQPAAESYRTALGIRQRLVEAEPDNILYLRGLGEGYRKLGDVMGLEGYPNLGDTMAAVDNYRKAAALGERIIAAQPDDPSNQTSYSVSTVNLAMLESTVGDNRSAIEHGRAAIAINEKIVAANPGRESYRLNLLSAYNVIRFPLVDEMLFDEAIENVQRAISSLEQMSQADPKNTFLKRSLGVSINGLGRVQTEAGDARSAIKNHERVLAMVEEMIAADPKSGEQTRDRALTLEFLGNAQLKAGDCAGAMTSYRRAVDFYDNQKSASDDLSTLYSGIARCLAAGGSLAEAAKTVRDAIPFAEKSAQGSPHNIRKQTRVAIYYLESGKILATWARSLRGDQHTSTRAEARGLLEKSARIFGELQSSGRLSKLNSGYPAAVQKELEQISA